MNEVPRKGIHGPRLQQILSSMRWPTPEAIYLYQAKKAAYEAEKEAHRETRCKWVQTPRGWRLTR